MFCPSCGNQIPDGAAFCPACGNSTASSNQQSSPATYGAAPAAAAPAAAQPYQQPAQQSAYPQPPAQMQQQYGQQQYNQQQYNQQQYAQPQYAQAQYAQPAMEPYPQYKSLGGWLLFFVIVYILDVLVLIGSGVTGFGTAALLGSYLGSEVGLLFSINAFISIAFGALYIVFIVFIFKRNPNFLKLFQIAGIASVAISIILTLAINALVGDYLAYINYDVVSSMMPSIIGGVIGLLLMTMYYCKSVRVRTYMGSTEYQRKALFRIGA